jgi:hypothetical protein
LTNQIESLQASLEEWKTLLDTTDTARSSDFQSKEAGACGFRAMGLL